MAKKKQVAPPKLTYPALTPQHFTLASRFIDWSRFHPALLYRTCKVQGLTPQAEEELSKQVARRCMATAEKLAEELPYEPWTVEEALYLKRLLILLDHPVWEERSMALEVDSFLLGMLHATSIKTLESLRKHLQELSDFCTPKAYEADGTEVLYG